MEFTEPNIVGFNNVYGGPVSVPTVPQPSPPNNPLPAAAFNLPPSSAPIATSVSSYMAPSVSQQFLSPSYHPVYSPSVPTFDYRAFGTARLEPTAPTIDFRVFTPPKTVVEITPSPTAAPTKPVQAVVKKTIETDQITYEAIGSIDLVTVERGFFEETQWLFTPYLAQSVGFVLQTYKLTLTFLETTRIVNPIKSDEDESHLFYSIFEVQVRFDLEGPMIDLERFTKAGAKSIVLNFFKGEHLEELLGWLKNKEIPINVIRLYDPDSTPPTPALDEEEPSTDAGGSSGGGSKHALAIILVCITFILLAFAMVFFVKRRKAKMPRNSGKSVESALNSVYSSGSQRDTSVAKLETVPEQEQEQTIEEHDLEQAYIDPFAAFDSTSSGEHLLGGNTIPSGDGEQQEDSEVYQTERVNDEEHLKEPDAEDQERNLYFHDAAAAAQSDCMPFDPISGVSQAALTSLDGHGSLSGLEKEYPDCMPFDPVSGVSQAALTSLDGHGSLSGLEKEYPEFDMFVNVPPQKDQQVSQQHKAIAAEANINRRQWQDEVVLNTRHDQSIGKSLPPLS